MESEKGKLNDNNDGDSADGIGPDQVLASALGKYAIAS
jgi:hypothetical protein